MKNRMHLKDVNPSAAFLREFLESLARLRGAAYARTGNQADADDLMQSTAVKALAAHGQFEAGTNMGAWLYRIMKNEVLDRVRASRRARVRLGLDEVPESLLTYDADQTDALEVRDVVRAFNRLPISYRQALHLRVEGLGYPEIAATLGCPVGTVKSRVAKARRRMRVLLRAKPVFTYPGRLSTTLNRPPVPRG